MTPSGVESRARALGTRHKLFTDDVQTGLADEA
jgi:hypothetical protein